jgi:lipopolysaccharide transport system permease protein
MINPVTPAVELLRYAILGQGSVHWGFYALSLGLTAALFLFGIVTFNRVEKTFMDTV